MSGDRAVIIGAGIGGLAAAMLLAHEGYSVTVLERAARAGGKMREVEAASARVDAGPTVLTMRWVFDALFETVGAHLGDYLALRKLSILARHAWEDGAQLDLLADQTASADAIGALAGAAEANGYRRFCKAAQRMYQTLRDPFLLASKPDPLTLTARIGPARIGDLLAIRPFDTMWSALGGYFKDKRLRQLFGRYATYCGSSPFSAPATLMLIAHVEQEGVWIVEGGMQRLAEALTACAEWLGVSFRFGCEASRITAHAGRVDGVVLSSGDRILADTVVCNADPAALSAGLFGREAALAVGPGRYGRRSLSAVTWAVQAKTAGFSLARHNVFFSDDYKAEFDALFDAAALPASPTIYVCAQDRDDDCAAREAERLLMLVNAPARGAERPYTTAELDACRTTVFNRLRRLGLALDPMATTRSAPMDFDALFPATNGALYGRATHGWAAAFQRPGSRTNLPGLYLAGGSVHPGAGVPMAALSGQLAARCVTADRASTRQSRRAATPGGTLMRSATTNNSA
jgi:1-hydroxycarotenoid 3,4-desaturase